MPVADLGGGMGGMHPPHQPKPNESGRKITPNFSEDLFFFFFRRPPNFGRKKRLEFPISAEKSLSILVKTFFFFFFFGDHLISGEKRFEFLNSVEKSLSISVKTSEFLRFCA